MFKKKNNNSDFDDEYKIDESQFEIEQEKENTNEQPEETEIVPIDEKNETIHFPWFIAIIIGVLIVLIIACIIVIKVLEH